MSTFFILYNPRNSFEEKQNEPSGTVRDAVVHVFPHRKTLPGVHSIHTLADLDLLSVTLSINSKYN